MLLLSFILHLNKVGLYVILNWKELCKQNNLLAIYNLGQ